MKLSTPYYFLQACPPPLRVILTEKENERECETLLDNNRFRVIDVEDHQSNASYSGLACHKMFWRCLIGNFTTYCMAVV